MLPFILSYVCKLLIEPYWHTLLITISYFQNDLLKKIPKKDSTYIFNND